MKLTHKILANLPLCKPELDRLRAAVPTGSFDAVTAIHAYIKAGGTVPNVARAYQALVDTDLLPDVGLIWKIARIAFRKQSEASGLRVWAVKLGPDNWQEAYAATKTATTTTAAAAIYAAAAAIYAADAYAYLTVTNARAAARAVAYTTATNARAAAYTADVNACAAQERVDAEIIAMIIKVVE